MERTILLYQQRKAIKDQEYTPENNLNCLLSQFMLTKLYQKDILEEIKEADQIYKKICILAFIIGIPN